MNAMAAMAVTATTANAMAQAVPEPDRTGGWLGGTGGCSSGVPMSHLKATSAPSKCNHGSKSTVDDDFARGALILKVAGCSRAPAFGDRAQRLPCSKPSNTKRHTGPQKRSQ